jgi:malonyl-CoA O-methyltransferase
MVADAEKIKLTQKFDLICSNSCFQWFASPHKTIKKYWAKLASGGHLVFSVFGPKTYQELQIALKLFYPHPPRTAAAKFLNKNHWQQLLTKLGGGTTIKEIKLKEKYPFLLDLLKTIKYTGTRGEGLGNLTLSRRQLSRLEEIYKAKFGKIVATHQIFYCRAKKIAPCS